MAEGDAAAAPQLREALLHSRQRWRDLVAISCDIAFETDASGHFVFLSPGSIIGWQVNELLGRPSELLLPDAGGGTGFNPFRAATLLRNRRVWLKCPDGRLCWMSISAAPLHDAAGVFTGTRGIGRDLADQDGAEAAAARAVRRSDLIDHILRHMQTELLAPRMMMRALQALVGALGAQGAMVVAGPVGTLREDRGEVVGDLLHEVGGDCPRLRAQAASKLAAGQSGPLILRGDLGEIGMLCAVPTRFSGCPGLLVWRGAGRRHWEPDDLALLASVIGTIRVVLEHAAIQREMARESRMDSLTGLANRRAFMEELTRRLDRLEYAEAPGTLILLDMDQFRTLNERQGHEVGDEALLIVAGLLRVATRPGDVVARLGADLFATWMDSMDDLAAAERADQLCRQVPAALAQLCGGAAPTASVGVTTRWPGSATEAQALLLRADTALRQAKHAGTGQWRVWREATDGA
jgi:diguanylate cyclase (GGDEF)-like protein/PAS domain S-box-containing protein